ncbi:hypothetical protein HDV03_000244 [Kappamyces sp. JEL0829]|nr:hypothetical protein HDV03_000244 [Kappamyces sp. JEL0829]
MYGELQQICALQTPLELIFFAISTTCLFTTLVSIALLNVRDLVHPKYVRKLSAVLLLSLLEVGLLQFNTFSIWSLPISEWVFKYFYFVFLDIGFVLNCEIFKSFAMLTKHWTPARLTMVQKSRVLFHVLMVGGFYVRLSYLGQPGPTWLLYWEAVGSAIEFLTTTLFDSFLSIWMVLLILKLLKNKDGQEMIIHNARSRLSNLLYLVSFQIGLDWLFVALLSLQKPTPLILRNQALLTVIPMLGPFIRALLLIWNFKEIRTALWERSTGQLSTGLFGIERKKTNSPTQVPT